MTKEEQALKFLDLPTSEIEEMLTSLFRRGGYRIREMVVEHGIPYFHLTESQAQGVTHTVSCWVADKKKLEPDQIEQIFKEIPPALGTEAFEKRLLLTPYEFTAEGREKVKASGVDLIDGSFFLDLLQKYEVPYQFPGPFETLANRIGKKAPYLLTPVFLLIAFFVYKGLNSTPAATGNRPVPAATLSPSPSGSPSPVAAVIPTPSASPAATQASPSPAPVVSASPAVKESPSPAPTESASPFTQTSPSPAPSRVSPRLLVLPSPAATHAPPKTTKKKPTPKKKTAARKTVAPKKIATPAPVVKRVTSKPPRQTVKPHRKTPSNGYESPGRIEGRVERYYSKIFDLQEKYYRMALDFEHRRRYDLARKYYEKYLQIAPNGTHAAAARQALQNLPAR